MLRIPIPATAALQLASSSRLTTRAAETLENLFAFVGLEVYSRATTKMLLTRRDVNAQ